jgi:hypothetical protein
MRQKYENVTPATPATTPQPANVTVRRGMQKGADSDVPFRQAAQGAAFIFGIFAALTVLGIVVFEPELTEKGVIVLLGIGGLIFSVSGAWLYFKRLSVADGTLIERAEMLLGVNLDSNPQIGPDPRLVPVNDWRKAAEKRNAEEERADMLRFVDALYEKGGTSYDHLRSRKFGTNTQIRERMLKLAAPEWGILAFEEHGNRVRVKLLCNHTEARRRIERALGLDE